MKRCIALFLAATLLLAMPVFAEDTLPWKNVNGWSIFVDPSMGNACYMATTFDNGVGLRFGFNFLGKEPLLYLSIGNMDWKSLEVGKDYPIQVQFDDNPVWTATAFVTDMSGVKFLNITTADTNFAKEFSHKLALRLSFQGKFVTGVRLTGSAAAVSELLNCQTKVNAVSGAKNGAPATDPFQQQPSPTPMQKPRSGNDPFSL
ncbi:hypothetical protein [Rhizobium tropici]|uniref:hypothetical protein n=1 Tax=Rhizobium tropici TaxID=398 RepID=UPI0015EBFBF8|nr:hypothetical protein [Rhizobium tropici]